MPIAFSLAHGLDLETELASFLAWLRDVREVMAGGEGGSKEARETLAALREEFESIAAAQTDPESARFALSLAVALVGFHYASHQKLLKALESLGLLEAPAAQPIFDTIVEPPLEGPEPPR